MNTHDSQKNGKIGFYCTRCKRHLRTKICTIHGMQSVIVLDMHNHLQLPSGEAAKSAAAASATNNAAPKTEPVVQSQPAMTQKSAAPQPKPVTAKQPVTEKKPPVVESAIIEQKPTIVESAVIEQKPTIVETPVAEKAAPKPTLPVNPQTIEAEPKVKIAGRSRRMFGEFAQEQPKTDEKIDENALSSLIESKLEALKERAKTETPAPKKTEPVDDQTFQREQPQLYPIIDPDYDETPWWKISARKYGVAVALLVLAATGFYGFVYPKYTQTVRFERAEELFHANDFRKAKAQYELFALKYPLDPRISIVKNRLEALDKLQEKENLVQDKLHKLMERATVAYKQKRYLTPEHDNAVLYINDILAERADYSMALALREQIVTHYFEMAENALDANQYEMAVDHFQKIRQITPDDPVIAEQINRALELRQLDERLQKLSQLAKAKTDVNKLRQEMERLKSEIRSEQQKLQAIREMQKDNAPVQAESKNRNEKEITGAVTAPKSAIDNSGTTSELGIELVAAPAPIKLVEETLIDGGKKHYVQKNKPEIAKKTAKKKEGVTMVLAECVVDTNGEVTSVTLVNGADDQHLNQIAMESFRKYRYKPATFNGDPVRFKSLEVMAF